MNIANVIAFFKKYDVKKKPNNSVSWSLNLIFFNTYGFYIV